MGRVSEPRGFFSDMAASSAHSMTHSETEKSKRLLQLELWEVKSKSTTLPHCLAILIKGTHFTFSSHHKELYSTRKYYKVLHHCKVLSDSDSDSDFEVSDI